MCMATPVEILQKVNGKKKAMVTGDKEVDVSLIDDAKKGDWLLVHGNLAVNKISKKEADNIFNLIGKCSHNHEYTHTHTYNI